MHALSLPSSQCDTDLLRQTKHLALTRWRPERAAVPDNLVMLTKEEADAHDALGEGAAEKVQAEDPELYAKVERTLREARCMFQDGWLWEGRGSQQSQPVRGAKS